MTRSPRVDLRCREHRLQNGLRLLVHEEPAALVTAVNVWYHVGSRNEEPGRTGFAHLFEHLMFEGSANVAPGEFDRLLEHAGGINNGSTTQDRTNYWITVPPTALELALFLEADRMGGLLEALTEERFETQRDVVRNERREVYENRPYGLAEERLQAALYPDGHPYRWPVIGHMRDLDAATFADAEAFFGRWYRPDNATLAIAGAVRAEDVLGLVTRYFGDIPTGRIPSVSEPPMAKLDADVHEILEDRVQQPRAYLGWHSPAAFHEGDAALDVLAGILGTGKASRLYRDMVIEKEIAVDAWAHHVSGRAGSVFEIGATAPASASLSPIRAAVRGVIRTIAGDGISQEELDNAVTARLTGFVDALQSMGGFGGRADRLNLYAFHTGDPQFASADVERYTRLGTDDVRRAAARWLDRPCAVVSVVPAGKPHLAAEGP